MRTGLAQRAKVVLLAADAVPVKEIVERVEVSKPTGSSVTASCPPRAGCWWPTDH